MEKDLEGKYFAFIFRADYFGKFFKRTPLAIYQVQDGKLEEIRHPVDASYDEINWGLWDFLKDNNIDELNTLDRKVRKFMDLDMDFFERSEEPNYPGEFGITWFRYWPIEKDKENHREIIKEIKEKGIELKYVSP